MDKRALRDSVVASLRRELDVLLAAALSTREGATHEENRPEHDKDTRAIEASYLAGAQAERVAEIRRAIDAIESMALRTFDAGQPIALSALVTVERDGRRSSVFVAPQGGGAKCVHDGREVQLVTTKSPLGAALISHRAGDVVEVTTQSGVHEYEIIDVE